MKSSFLWYATLQDPNWYTVKGHNFPIVSKANLRSGLFIMTFLLHPLHLHPVQTQVKVNGWPCGKQEKAKYTRFPILRTLAQMGDTTACEMLPVHLLSSSLWIGFIISNMQATKLMLKREEKIQIHEWGHVIQLGSL